MVPRGLSRCFYLKKYTKVIPFIVITGLSKCTITCCTHKTGCKSTELKGLYGGMVGWLKGLFGGMVGWLKGLYGGMVG